MKKIISQLVVAIVCALLGFLLTYQFKALRLQEDAKTAAQNQDILSQIEVLKKERDELSETNKTLSDEIKRLEENAAEEGALENEIKKQLDNTRMHLGLLDVKGSGITITIIPKTTIFGENTTDSSVGVSEEEIVHIINLLWYSRAEAISVNDIRITPQTGIKTSGKSIAIGSVGLVDPKSKIVIKAIGDKAKLNVGVSYGNSLGYGALKNYNVETKTSDDIVINKTSQSLRNEYIKPVQ